jgi:hypothetical protein
VTTPLGRIGLTLAKPQLVNIVGIEEGRVWPRYATTMMGRTRLRNIRQCVEHVLRDDVPGDLIETGVWRGGGAIFMRGVLKAWGDKTRTVIAADSYRGLPEPNADVYPGDAQAFPFHEHNDVLGVSIEDVRRAFARFGLLDDRVQFLKGWFKDTLPALRGLQWSVLRLDADLYESTIQALENLYPGLSQGGWIIVDDYGAIDVCKRAVDDYRAEQGITDPIQHIDHSGVCWQRT